jgi:ribosomal protein L7/L12
VYDDEAVGAVAAAVRAQLTAGVSMNEAIAFVRARGFYQIQSIKILMCAAGISLAEAKQLVHASPTWADQREAAEALHKQLYQALDEIASRPDVQQRGSATDRTQPDCERPRQRF